MIPDTNSIFEFLTKGELIKKWKEEKIILTQEVEDKIKEFDETSVISIEISVNSPAKVINAEIFNGQIVNFINDNFEKDGIKREVINNTFEGLND